MSDGKYVIRADVMGFCMGVKAVMRKVEGEIESGSSAPLYTYGPLIHNRLVVEKLRSRGVSEIEFPEEGRASGTDHRGTIVIRAHGIHPRERERFARDGYRIVEGTCPRVLHSQKTVFKYSEMGWFIIIVGDKNHGEVRAIEGCAENSVVVLSENDALALEIPDQTLVIAQTTLSMKEYDNICRILLGKNENIKIIKSICPATRQRQDSLHDLIGKVDAVVVIGGKNSANTRRLYLRAQAEGIPVWHVEDVEDLPPELGSFDRIGITAGASTPDWIIDDIEAALKEMQCGGLDRG